VQALSGRVVFSFVVIVCTFVGAFVWGWRFYGCLVALLSCLMWVGLYACSVRACLIFGVCWVLYGGCLVGGCFG